jgi:hypothetical protein
VRFTGYVSEAEKAVLFRQAWMLVHAAPWEGWGLVITEAGLAATPSLAFDVDGVRDAIDHQRSGLLARSRDDFVQAWCQLSADETRRRSLGDAAMARARQFIGGDLIGAFEETLDDATGRGLPRTNAVLSSAGQMGTTTGPIPLSVVIPAFNEEARLPDLLAGLAALPGAKGWEVIVVDDGSADSTAEVAVPYLSAFRRASVLSHSSNRGKGAALRTGVSAARGQAIVFLDADNATDLRALDQLMATLESNDVAIGSRTASGSEVRNGSLHRRVMGVAYNQLARRLTSLEVSDSQCGCKAFRGPVARLLFGVARSDRFGQDVELLELATIFGFSVAEVPVIWTAVAGSQVQVVRDSARSFVELLRLRRRGVPGAAVDILWFRRDGVAPAVVAKELRTVLRATDIVVAMPEMAAVILIADAPQGQAALRDRVLAELGLEPARVERTHIGATVLGDPGELGRRLV